MTKPIFRHWVLNVKNVLFVNSNSRGRILFKAKLVLLHVTLFWDSMVSFSYIHMELLTTLPHEKIFQKLILKNQVNQREKFIIIFPFVGLSFQNWFLKLFWVVVRLVVLFEHYPMSTVWTQAIRLVILFWKTSVRINWFVWAPNLFV